MKYLFDSTYYSSIIPRDNLWSEWTFDQYSANGSILLDTSGNNRHCTLTGSSKIIHDNDKGKCFYFDDTNYFVTTNTHTIGSIASVSFWSRMYPNVDTNGMMYSFNSTAFISGVDVWWYNNVLYNNKGDGQSSPFSNTSGIANTNWHHYVVLYNGTTSTTLYMDNILIGTANAHNVAMTTAAKFYIARSNYDTTYNYTGKMKNFRIYEKLLTTEEIGLLYNEGMNCMVNK